MIGRFAFVCIVYDINRSNDTETRRMDHILVYTASLSIIHPTSSFFTNYSVTILFYFHMIYTSNQSLSLSIFSYNIIL